MSFNATLPTYHATVKLLALIVAATLSTLQRLKSYFKSFQQPSSNTAVRADQLQLCLYFHCENIPDWYEKLNGQGPPLIQLTFHNIMKISFIAYQGAKEETICSSSHILSHSMI